MVGGADADVVFALADGPGGIGLYRLLNKPNGLAMASRSGLDATRRLSTLELSNTPAERLGIAQPAQMTKFFDHLCVALAHEQIGGAQALFDSTVAYTKSRYQFGRPIGSFQALKHRCADLLLELELAKSVVYEAAACLDREEPASELASMAKAMSSETLHERGSCRDPTPRRNRIYLGRQYASVVQAREEFRSFHGNAVLSPRQNA